jgi:hypothetical protein
VLERTDLWCKNGGFLLSVTRLALSLLVLVHTDWTLFCRAGGQPQKEAEGRRSRLECCGGTRGRAGAGGAPKNLSVKVMGCQSFSSSLAKVHLDVTGGRDDQMLRTTPDYLLKVNWARPFDNQTCPFVKLAVLDIAAWSKLGKC